MRYWCVTVVALLAVVLATTDTETESTGSSLIAADVHQDADQGDWIGIVGLNSNSSASSHSDEPPNAEALIGGATAEDRMDDYHYEDAVADYEDSEYLPDPEALIGGGEQEDGDDDEVVVLDEETRIQAEALIQELDSIGSKLRNDDDTVNSSPIVSQAEVKQLEKLLETAGLGPNSPTLQNLMNQRQNAIPAEEALGPGMGGVSGLTHLMSGNGVAPAAQGLTASLPLTTGLTKRNIEDIKRELRQMLFGSEANRQRKEQNRRQGGFRRPAAAQNNRFNSNTVRRPNINKNPEQRQQFNNNPQQKQQRPPLPLFLRPPRPSPRPGGAPQQKPPSSSSSNSGRPSASSNEVALSRQPINEFHPPASDFRLPESPFRQQIAATNFSPPPRTNNGNQNSGSLRPSPSSLRPFNPSPKVPRPSEEEFRPLLLNNNNNNQKQQQQQRPSSGVNNNPVPVRFPQPPPLSSSSNNNNNQLHPTSSSSALQPQLRQPQSAGPIKTQPPTSRPVFAIPTGAGGILNNGNFDATGNSGGGGGRNRIPVKPECDLFAEGVCLDVRNYPTDVISNYLNRNKPALETMLAEVRSQSADDLVDGVSAFEERKYSYSHYYGNRRQGEDTHAHRDFAEDGGFLCPSEVKYARPQLAQTSRGVWKYIINMGEHTQTIRMERCLKPGGSCSYVSPHYKSHCIQVYNYHRLLSFEEGKGMHVDIYKIPVGCSCHVQGYAYLYPPLDGKIAGHIIPPAFKTEEGNSLSSNNRKTTTTNANSREEPLPPLGPPPSLDRDPFRFDAPPSLKEFSSFMEEQFGGHFGPFGSKTGRPSGNNNNNNNRRSDNDGSDDQISEPSNVSNTKKKTLKTNYDYHPIIDFFNDKP